MKKTFGFFEAIWAISLALFNAIVFIVPNTAKFSEAFWTGYIFITLAFIDQLVCAYFAFKPSDKTKSVLQHPFGDCQLQRFDCNAHCRNCLYGNSDIA